MADGDPDLAAKLLAAFSVPAPTEEDSTTLSATPEQHNHDPEPHNHVAEPQTQPSETYAQTQESHFQTPEPVPVQSLGAPIQTPGPAIQESKPFSRALEPEPQVPAAEPHFPSEPPNQTPGPPAHSPDLHTKLEPQSHASGLELESQETVAQAPEPHVAAFDSQTFVPESSEPPLIPPPPPSPVKRQRSPEHDGHTAEKRLKVDHDGHDGFDHHPIDFSAANWDISAMIQNALGSFDEQLHHPDHLEHSGPIDDSHAEPNDGTKQEPAPEPMPHISPVVKKMDHKHMKFSSNPYYMMRTMSLASLGSLAIQILLALSQQSREETLALISDQESEYRKAYDILKSALDAARRIFSDSSPLLSPDELEISDSEDRETLRVSNLAAISTNAIAGDDSLIVDGHDQFFSIFIQDEGEFTRDLSELYMSMKTQALISSLKNANNPSERSDVLDRFFPPDFDDQLKQRHGDTTFSSGREDLVAEIGRKRQEFLEAILDDERRLRLPVDYPMNGFLDSLVVYLQDHLAVIIDYAEKYGINIPASEESVVNEPLGNGNVQDDHDELSALLQSATSKLLEELPGLGDMGNSGGTGDSLSDSLGLGKLIQESLQNQGAPKDEAPGTSGGDGSGLFESGGLASLIAAKLNNGFENLASHSQTYGNGQGQLSGLGQATTTAPSPYLAQYNQLAQAPYYSYNNQPPPPPPPPPADGEQLPPNQTLPTSQLYERARQAAVAKSNNAARREGIHSTRRAWTPEEERALMTGLDMVKGPHWSQILSLFGPNGSISDILKDRTQVQLKDKARNLKLFFLKTNSEMPYYLQCVTGELKTRAPGQAARKEAEEKARQNSEDEQARIAGIMTLAGGLQHNHPTVNNHQVGQSNQTNQVNNFQANQVSNHQTQASNGFSSGHMQTPMQGSPAQARTTLRPTTPNTVGQNGGLAAIAPNMNTNTNMGNSVTPQPNGTTAPMTPSMNSMTPLAPRLPTGNVGPATPTPTMPHVAIAPAPAVPSPTSPAVKSEPQDHLPQIQPKPEPQPLQASQPPPQFGQQQQQDQQQGQQQTPYHQVQQHQQSQQPQQLQQPQQPQQSQQSQQPQQPSQTQPPRVHITLPPVAPPTLAPAAAPAPSPAQPYTHPATEISNTQDAQTSGVTDHQQVHHDGSQSDGLPRHFEHQEQPQAQPSHLESHTSTHEQVNIFGHHEQHHDHDHHDNTDITALLQTLQAATASIS